ncbi:MAG: hypothetical protein ACKO8H_02525, partial [Microcystis panniformis]
KPQGRSDARGARCGAARSNLRAPRGAASRATDQMIFLRPLPEIANYKTPIKNLYLTGAGTHPGGSISGMPGRNCAQVFLRDQSTFLQRLFN